MPDQLDDVRRELALANRILGHEGIIDAFGHASVRHPRDPNRYLLSCSRSPLWVDPEDILEFDLDSEPVKPLTVQPYGERVIHGEIYKARPDVNAVVHHHAPAVMPFCMTGVELLPLCHTGATMGEKVPFWDQSEEFGDTNLLVVKPEEGASLARALGDNWTVLMRKHGATVAGISIQQAVFRSVFGCLNAQYQLQAMLIGKVGTLSRGEVRAAGGANLMPRGMARAWEYWTLRLGERGRFPARAATASRGKPKAKAAASKSAKRSGRRRG